MSTDRNETPRQKLLDAASRLFYEQGIAATGIDRLLAEAGVAKMTLYNAFGSKEGLVVEYLRQRYGGFVPALRKTVEERHENAAERILGVFDVMDEWFRSPGFRGCPLLNAAIEFSDRAHSARETASTMVEEFRSYMEELASLAGAGDSAAMAEELCIVAYGAISWSQITRSPSPAATAGRMARKLLAANGIAVSEGREKPRRRR